MLLFSSFSLRILFSLVTRDTESGQACEENNLPFILLDNNEIFKIVVDKLKKP